MPLALEDVRAKLGEEGTYAIAFATPFLFVFFLFVIIPILIEFHLSFLFEPMIGTPRVGLDNFYFLQNDPIYTRSLFNTLLYVGFAVNIKMLLSLFLSGLLTIRHKAVRLFNALYLLPWAVPLIAGAVMFRWMLSADWGIINILFDYVSLPRINWLGQWSTGLASVIMFHIWKYTPFWTLILFAGRQGIPMELYEAAEVDGANILSKFKNVTLPLLKNLYLMCTLISAIWTLGDFVVVWLITRGGPADLTHVISTLAYRYGFWIGNINVGAATIVTLLPMTLMLMFVVLKWFRPVA